VGTGGEPDRGPGQVDARERGGGREDLRDGGSGRYLVQREERSVGERGERAGHGVERESVRGRRSSVLLRLLGED
jgi:hypothetical protein